MVDNAMLLLLLLLLTTPTPTTTSTPTMVNASSFSFFLQAWREAVASASDATQLMQCQVMLEYGVRTAWYTHEGLRLFSCMPARLTGE